MVGHSGEALAARRCRSVLRGRPYRLEDLEHQEPSRPIISRTPQPARPLQLTVANSLFSWCVQCVQDAFQVSCAFAY